MKNITEDMRAVEMALARFSGKECKPCSGTGKVKAVFRSPFGEAPFGEGNCPFCGGTGKVRKQKEKA